MNHILLTIPTDFFSRTFMGQGMVSYIWFAGIIVGTLLLKKPLTAGLMWLSSKLMMRYSYVQHKSVVNGLLFRPLERLLLTVLFFIASEQISGLLDSVIFRRRVSKQSAMNINLGDVTDHVFLFLFIIYLTQSITGLIDFIYYVRMGRADAEKNRARQQLYPLLKEMAKLLTWTCAAFWVMGAVCHVNVPALITGLGIGGVAIALAGKETVENFFAAFTILSDKPFQVGDTIKLGDIEGVVERIGFRSARLRNTDGSAYIIPNQNLVSQNLINLSMRDKRGMKLLVNIKYGISHTDLQTLIGKIKEALLAMPHVIEPVEVHIEGFDKETFQMIVSYSLPHPLPDDETLNTLKRKVNMKVYELISASATIGTPIGTA